MVEAPQDQVEGNLVVDMDAAEEEISHLARSILTPLLATGAGCMAIWPMIVPNLVMHSHRKVALLALPVEGSLNPGTKAHSEEEAVEGKSGSVPSMCYLTRTGMSILWTMQVSCKSHWTVDRLLLVRLRWKLKKKEKTEKVLCQCGS